MVTVEKKNRLSSGYCEAFGNCVIPFAESLYHASQWVYMYCSFISFNEDCSRLPQLRRPPAGTELILRQILNSGGKIGLWLTLWCTEYAHFVCILWRWFRCKNWCQWFTRERLSQWFAHIIRYQRGDGWDLWNLCNRLKWHLQRLCIYGLCECLQIL